MGANEDGTTEDGTARTEHVEDGTAEEEPEARPTASSECKQMSNPGARHKRARAQAGACAAYTRGRERIWEQKIGQPSY